MTTIEISLPDEVAQRARHAGLLSDTAIRQLLEDALRRQAGRALMDVARQIQHEAVPAISMEAIDAEVKAVRTERQRLEAARRQSQGEESKT